MPNHHKIARSTRKSVCAARQAIRTNTSRAQSHTPRVANRSPRKPFSTSAKLTRCFGDSAAHVANALAGRRKIPPVQPVPAMASAARHSPESDSGFPVPGSQSPRLSVFYPSPHRSCGACQSRRHTAHICRPSGKEASGKQIKQPANTQVALLKLEARIGVEPI